MASVINYTALAVWTNLISGLGGTVPKYIGWGTGVGTSARSDTTLFTEAYSTSNNGSGNTRVAGTASRITTTQANDTMQVVGTLTAPTGGLTVTNVGLFDSAGTAANLTTAPSGGNLVGKSDFTGQVLNAGDSIQFTLGVVFA